MEHKEPAYPAQDAHQKAQEAIDHAHDTRERMLADRGKSKTEPRLIADGKLERCSVCGYPFDADVRASMTVAFAEHLAKAHKPGQTS